MLELVTVRDANGETTLRPAEIALISVFPHNGKQGGAITLIFKSGKEFSFWFKDDAALYLVQKRLTEAMV